MLIALCGGKGSGKTTSASYLVSNFGFVEYTIAGPLKDIARCFGFTDSELYEDKTRVNPQLGICAREFLQKFGSEVCREQLAKLFPTMNLGPTGVIWIKLMCDFIKAHPNKHIVVSDVRFPDELKILTERFGARVLKLDRQVESDAYSNHASEQELYHPTMITLDNNGNVQNLYEALDELMYRF